MARKAILERSFDIHSILRVRVRGDAAFCREIDYHLAPFGCDQLESPPDVILDRYDAAPSTARETAVDDYDYGGGAYHRPSGRIRYDFLGSPHTYYMDRLCLPTNLIVQLALLRTGHTFLHGAGLSIEGRQVLFPAYPGTGKTTLVAAFVRAGAKLYGDDLCIVGGGRIYSYPQALSVYPHHLPVLGYSDPAIARAFRRTTLLDRLSAPLAHSQAVPIRLARALVSRLRTPCVNIMPTVVFGDDAIASSGPLDEVVALERSGETDQLVCGSPDLPALAEQAAAILWHEWHPWFHDLLLYDALAESGGGTPRRFRQVRDLALEAFEPVRCSRVRIPANWDNAQLVRQFPAFWRDHAAKCASD